MPLTAATSQESLRDFLLNRQKTQNGVLQVFEPPASGRVSTLRVQLMGNQCTVEYRVSTAHVHNRRLPPRTRCATFDGPLHLSQDVRMGAQSVLRRSAEDLAVGLRDHIAGLLPPQYSIRGCQFFCRPGPAGTLRLLFVTDMWLDRADAPSPARLRAQAIRAVVRACDLEPGAPGS